mmetsp:Transcript_121716/g.378889  ORF Transcript_121716/g.378889 Transcript_121716/m.378889 type:complete len:216 (-) Transcript_121716:1130-1777(-)
MGGSPCVRICLPTNSTEKAIKQLVLGLGVHSVNDRQHLHVASHSGVDPPSSHQLYVRPRCLHKPRVLDPYAETAIIFLPQDNRVPSLPVPGGDHMLRALTEVPLSGAAILNPVAVLVVGHVEHVHVSPQGPMDGLDLRERQHVLQHLEAHYLGKQLHDAVDRCEDAQRCVLVMRRRLQGHDDSAIDWRTLGRGHSGAIRNSPHEAIRVHTSEAGP